VFNLCLFGITLESKLKLYAGENEERLKIVGTTKRKKICREEIVMTAVQKITMFFKRLVGTIDFFLRVHFE